MELLLVVISMLLSRSYAVQVETKYGTVEGLTETLIDDYHSGIELNTFYSIPFARPPVGELRFEPPQEPDPYDGVFMADKLASACDQNPALIWLTQPGWDDLDEDCLHLSIYAPADDSDGPYPVMLFIYGGGYQLGANVNYLGHFLAARGVVVVIPNYRLGMIGFGWSGDGVIPGNMGLMDQAFAMEYVQENIAAFGGDPDMVTIFGESAGAGSVGLQLMSPRSEGLFHQAILESGSEYNRWALNGPQHNAENYLIEAAEDLDCPTEDSQEMTDCLRNKTALELRQADFSCEEGRTCLGFAPVVDGEGGYIPDVPYNLRRREEFHQVPEMIGINRLEMGYLLVGLNNMTYEEFERRVRLKVRTTADAFPDEDREEDAVQAMLFYYSPWPHLEDSELLRHQYGEMMTDTDFGAAADQQAKEHRDYAPVYFYVFDALNEDTFPDYMGTPHGMELPYIFGYPFIPQNPDVLNQTGIISISDYTELDYEHSYFMMTLWTNFAKYGNPTPDPVAPPGDNDPVIWDTYTEDNLNYIYVGRDKVEILEDFRQHEYAFWQNYMYWMVVGDDGPDLPKHGGIQQVMSFIDDDDEECVLHECMIQAFEEAEYYHDY